MAKRRRKKYEFKPDAPSATWLKKLHLTALQRKILLKWVCYSALCLLLLLIQDVIMSRVHILGATTELVPCAILLITVMEDVESGSLFALLGSMVYVFTGSSPGAYVIAYLVVFGVAAAVFRRAYWHWSFTSNVLCAGIAMMLYELAVFATGIFLGLTYWSRVGVFALTGLYNWIVMAALYPLVKIIGKIGGGTWRE